MKSIGDILRDHAVFDDTGRLVGGTDKMVHHNYGDAYESLFSDREAVRLVMEVGITDGTSMLAWKEAFPNALIVGMDIQPSARAGRGIERLEFHQGDQRSMLDCERAAGSRQFDMIVDDACHELDAQLLTFGWLWPFVKPGGVYVVEEPADLEAFCRNSRLVVGIDPTIVGTNGPFGGIEPLIVLRKP